MKQATPKIIPARMMKKKFDMRDIQIPEKIRVSRWWYQRFRRSLKVSHGWRAVREFFFRGGHGWAPTDTWSLDKYLASVMGHSLEYLADHCHGWPGEQSEWPTMDDYTAELKKHARVLIAYSADWKDKVDAGPTIRRLAAIWGTLWD